jgi:hypothetical protein
VAVRGMGGRACVWRCNVGFYKHTLSGQCRPCQPPANRNQSLVTSGDDDSPLSCEPA